MNRIWKGWKSDVFRIGILTFLFVFAAVISATFSPGSSASAETSLTGTVYYSEGDRVVNTQMVNGVNYLFLPSAADLKNLTLMFKNGSAAISSSSGTKNRQTVYSGKAFDFTSLGISRTEAGCYPVWINGIPLKLMVSDHIAAMYLTSSDSSQNRLWVEKSKDNKAVGSMLMVNEDGSVVYDGGLKQIKGRGNSSWGYPKKPYQIKLEKSADLIETGQSNESSKTWVLLANYLDHTLLQNQLTFCIADRFSLPYTPHSRPVDLYYDGVYRGTYLLCEKTEVGTSRINVENLESEIEKLNSDKDLDTLPTNQMKMTDGSQLQYVSGLSLPEKMTGGYLLEMDFESRAKKEKSWFSTKNGQYVTVKSPEYLGKEGMLYISDLYKDFEDAIYRGGINEKYQYYSDLADLDSLARFYLLEELSGEADAYISSTFFYKYADDLKLYSGPVWDFDIAYGYITKDYKTVPDASLSKSVIAGEKKTGSKLLQIPTFQSEVKRLYESEFREIICDIVDNTLPVYREMISASAKMNSVMWPQNTAGDAGTAHQYLEKYLRERIQFLDQFTSSWRVLEENEYYDVPESKWFYDDVTHVSESNIMNGYIDRSFKPEQAMTRAMIAVVIYRMSGNPAVEYTESEASDIFTDIPESSWYTDAVIWAAQNNIVKGIDKGVFAPDSPIKRQDFITMIRRWKDCKFREDENVENTEADNTEGKETADPETIDELGIEEETNGSDSETEKEDFSESEHNPPGESDNELLKFADGDTVSDYAAEAVIWAVNVKLLHGNDKGELKPLDSLTRAEAAAILHRISQMETNSEQTGFAKQLFISAESGNGICRC